MTEPTPKTQVLIPAVVGVQDFAARLDLPVTKVIAELMKNGVMATINEQIDFDTAAIIAEELGFEATLEVAEARVKPVFEGAEQVDRPPIVAVMGHVDHGKTSLLDAIRESDVAAGEAGGITQHIGAYQVTKNGRKITFLDTPGHEAFAALRAHGARMTDIAIIVVAAEEGMKPQTLEAIRFAREANVNILIAITKIDKPGANPNHIKQQLSEVELVPEEWGGKTVVVEVSAKTKEGIDKLLDMVVLLADLAELKARVDGPADGVVVESHIVTGRGAVATVLIQSGMLRLGDVVLVGSTYGKIRSLEDYLGHKIREAGPAMPAIISGLKAVPAFGDYFEVVADEKTARERTSQVIRQSSIKSLVGHKKIELADISEAVQAGQVSELNVIVKADAPGSLESLTESLRALGNAEVKVKLVGTGVGDVSESDVMMAGTSGAVILGFNIGITGAVNQLATRSKVKLRIYKVIYELLDDVRDWLTQLLPPEMVEVEVGSLEVLGIFKVNKDSIVGGGKVESGKVESGLELHILRGKTVTGQGKVTSLQKDKQVAKEAVEGEMCGLVVATKDKFEVGDRLVFYRTESRKRSL